MDNNTYPTIEDSIRISGPEYIYELMEDSPDDFLLTPETEELANYAREVTGPIARAILEELAVVSPQFYQIVCEDLVVAYRMCKAAQDANDVIRGRYGWPGAFIGKEYRHDNE
ncbi:hypothetical protein [Paenibacillus polysaccharolyticus]|uniref:hypothetical protein n=1 Tax=Paenibacillus polysaccharolyticus TaxID=582692 RepID=UPI00300A8AA8